MFDTRFGSGSCRELGPYISKDTLSSRLRSRCKRLKQMLGRGLMWRRDMGPEIKLEITVERQRRGWKGLWNSECGLGAGDTFLSQQCPGAGQTRCLSKQNMIIYFLLLHLSPCLSPSHYSPILLYTKLFKTAIMGFKRKKIKFKHSFAFVMFSVLFIYQGQVLFTRVNHPDHGSRSVLKVILGAEPSDWCNSNTK